MIPLIVSLGVMVTPMIIGLVLVIRKMNRVTAQAEREALPFNPPPKPIPNAFLRKFPLAERTYLRQQISSAVIAYWMATWFFTTILSVSLIPHSSWVATDGITTKWTDPSAFAWFQYVQSATTGIQLSLLFVSFGTASAMFPLRQRPHAQFFRTRPLGSGFIFWARVLPILGAIIASVATGAALSLALLSVVKGPVWRHLPSAFPGTVNPADQHTQLYLALIATSVPRVFLSMCTTATLLFSAFVALLSIPFNRWIGQASTPFRFLPTMVLGILGVATINALDVIGILHLPSELFFYTHLGPPPPYAFAAVPILLSVALVFTARFFTSRLEL